MKQTITPGPTINSVPYEWVAINPPLIDRPTRRTLNRLRDTKCELIYGVGELPVSIDYPAYHRPILAQKTIDRAMTITRKVYLQFVAEQKRH